MKVAILTYDYPDDHNPAAGRFIQRHTEALAAHHDVRVVQARVRISARPEVRIGRREVDGRTVEQVLVAGPPGLAHLIAARHASSLVRRADVVHSMALESLFLAGLVRRPANCAWVHTEHSTEWSDPHATGLTHAWILLSKSQIDRPDAVTAVSGYLARSLEQARRQGDVRVVPNVVTVTDAAGYADRTTAAGDRLHVVSAGALVPMKRPVLAVEAIAELRGRRRDVHLTWIGSGPLERAMRDRAGDLGVADRLHLVPFIPPDEYLRLVRTGHVFLLPSAFETFCVVAAEAIGCGLPVVVSDRGGQTDFVDSEVGALVASDDPAAWADAVLDVRRRLPRLDDDRVAAHRQRFAPDTVAALFNEVYGTVMARRIARGKGER